MTGPGTHEKVLGEGENSDEQTRDEKYILRLTAMCLLLWTVCNSRALHATVKRLYCIARVLSYQNWSMSLFAHLILTSIMGNSESVIWNITTSGPRHGEHGLPHWTSVHVLHKTHHYGTSSPQYLPSHPHTKQQPLVHLFRCYTTGLNGWSKDHPKYRPVAPR